MLDLENYRDDLENLCNSQPIERLGIFGSSLTDKFNKDSDVDVLVVFDQSQEIDYFNKYFELKSRLEEIFNRSVDLIVDKQFKNPYFQKVVNQSRKVVYER
jgi:predicted nucleotidyltransferase